MKKLLFFVLLSVGCLLGLSVRAAEKAYLGITTMPITPILAGQLNLDEGIGLVVAFIDPDSPAASVLQEHDVLHKVDGQILVSQYQLAVLIRSMKPDQKVNLTVIRGGKPVKLPVTLAMRDLPPLPPPPTWGTGGGIYPGPRFRHPDLPGNDPNVIHTLQDLMDRLNRAGQAFDIDNWIQQFHNPSTPSNPGASGADEESIILDLSDEAGDQADATTSPGHQSQMTVQIKHDDKGLSRKVTLTEGDLSMVLQDRAGDKHLQAQQGDQELFDGAINTDEERAAIPDIVKPLLKRAEDGVHTKVVPHKVRQKKNANRDVLSL